MLLASRPDVGGAGFFVRFCSEALEFWSEERERESGGEMMGSVSIQIRPGVVGESNGLSDGVSGF